MAGGRGGPARARLVRGGQQPEARIVVVGHGAFYGDSWKQISCHYDLASHAFSYVLGSDQTPQRLEGSWVFDIPQRSGKRQHRFDITGTATSTSTGTGAVRVVSCTCVWELAEGRPRAAPTRLVSSSSTRGAPDRPACLSQSLLLRPLLRVADYTVRPHASADNLLLLSRALDPADQTATVL